MKVIFINSKGYWNSWFNSVSALQPGIEVLKKAGIKVEQVEVETLSELEKTLDGVSEETLLWPNAYFVNDETGKAAWLNDRIRVRGLPYIGSGAHTFQWTLQKNVCQSILAEHQLPVPPFLVIHRDNDFSLEHLIEAKNIEFPVVLKPTKESGSIGVCKADTLNEAKQFAAKILKKFPNSDVILEEFLPNDDITCCYLEMGNEVLLLPTYYIVKNSPSHKNILSPEDRRLSWDEVNKIQPIVSDPDILNQLKTNIRKIVNILDIKGITRIDGRLDKKGVLRFFDVNAMPALFFPEDVTVKQCLTFFPDYSPMKVYEGLIYTIVHHALSNRDMEVPATIQQNHLFALQSDRVIRCHYNNG